MLIYAGRCITHLNHSPSIVDQEKINKLNLTWVFLVNINVCDRRGAPDYCLRRQLHDAVKHRLISGVKAEVSERLFGALTRGKVNYKVQSCNPIMR